MNRRGAGVVFIAIAMYLISIKYILNFACVAGWWRKFSGAFLNDMNTGLSVFSTVALIVGIKYVVIAEIKKENKSLVSCLFGKFGFKLLDIFWN